jgi:hypothetical protein
MIFNLFKKRIPVLKMDDPDFGPITFDSGKGAVVGVWQMDGDWNMPADNAKLGCSSIPGDKNGPFLEARTFLLQIKSDANRIWQLSEVILKNQLRKWRIADQIDDVKDYVYWSSLSLDGPIATTLPSFLRDQGRKVVVHFPALHRRYVRRMHGRCIKKCTAWTVGLSIYLHVSLGGAAVLRDAFKNPSHRPCERIDFLNVRSDLPADCRGDVDQH